jgi:peptidyl-prolyl cis-trans isomerase A (cyclophilin A)
MHSLRAYVIFSISLLGLTGCDHKKQQAQSVAPSEPTPTQPAPDPSPGARAAQHPEGSAGGSAELGSAAASGSGNAASGGNEVRKPTKDDLAAYTKDIAGKGKLVATIETSMGAFHCELFGDKAPMTVANFVGLATGKKPWQNPKTGSVETNKPYFEGLTFHRVIPGFMIQGGDPTGTGTSGPGYSFQDEFADGTTMGPGALAMANAGKGPDGGGTNGSQFFIMEGSRPDLVGRHTIFGQCKEVDLVKKIAAVPTTNDKPNTPVTIKKISFAKN